MSGKKINSVHISFEMKVLFEMKFHTVVKKFLFIGFYRNNELNSKKVSNFGVIPTYLHVSSILKHYHSIQ